MSNYALLKSGEEEIVNELKNSFDWAESANIFVSYAHYTAFKLLKSSIITFLRHGHKLRTLFDLQIYYTDPKIIDEFITIPGDSECKVIIPNSEGSNNSGLFHIKNYFYQKDDQYRIVVGSSNFTKGGLIKNLESNIILTGNINDQMYPAIIDYLNHLWDLENAIRPEDHYEVIEEYKLHYRRFNKSRVSERKKTKSSNDKLIALYKSSGFKATDYINYDTSYLLGLVAGGGYLIDPNQIIIRYHKGIFNKNSEHEGFIYAENISDLRLSQKKAFKRDIARIVERLGMFFSRIKSGDEITIHKHDDYNYDLVLNFKTNSPILTLLNDYISECTISGSRIIPILPTIIRKINNNKIYLSFIRGYCDIRGRIRPTDRTGTDGPLRIAVSFSTGADEFAREFQAILENNFSVRRINFLSGTSRGRETMLRIDPVDLSLLPSKMFSISWKQMLLDDFAKYNRNTFRDRYITP